MLRRLLIAFLVSLSTPAFASAGIYESWNNLRLQSDRLVVDAAVTPSTGNLASLVVTLDGKAAVVPANQLANLPATQLLTATVEWGCGQASWSHPELDSDGVYCQNVSFQFDDGPEKRPDWYEPPRVTFTFSGGRLIERRITRKVDPHSWSTGVG